MDYIKRLESQVYRIPIIQSFSNYHDIFSVEKVNAFTKPCVARLISNRGIELVQKELDADSINVSMNFITSLIEIASLKEGHLQNFISCDEQELELRMWYILSIVNTSVAFDLKEIGIKNIPRISFLQIDIFYGEVLIKELVKRVLPTAVQLSNSDSYSNVLFIRQLIIENLMMNE